MVVERIVPLGKWRRETLSFARILLWPVTLLAIAAAILDLGVWPMEKTVQGPFPVETPGTHAHILTLSNNSVVTRLTISGDDSGDSDLRLWINGSEIWPPHALHEDIRNGTTTGFSHWHGSVIFSLPAGVANAATTLVTVRYSLRPRTSITAFLMFASACLWLLVFWRRTTGPPYPARILLWSLLVLAIAAIILELGVWTREETHSGPFPADVAGTHAVYVSAGVDLPFSCCFEARSDTPDAPFQSDLRLWVNGRELEPPHAIHADIRSGATTGFSYWDGHVIFSLPPGVANTAETSVMVRYSILPRRGITASLLLASTCFWLLFYWRRIPALINQRGEAIVRAPYVLLHVFGYLSLAAALIYIACSLVAFVEGWALPTTALIKWSSIALWLARHEPQFGFSLLVCAAFGTVATWFALLVPEGNLLVQREETALLRFFRLFGFVIVTCVFVFSISTMWAGIVRPGDLDGSSIGGLVPFSDAGGYMAGASDEAKNGFWPEFSLRRPLAAAFRTVLLFFSGYSYSSMLLLQACLLSAVSCFATWAVVRWRGLWAGVAFFGLTYTYVRVFAPTTLTEPLGLCWALFSIPFFIEALRARSLASALVALGATTVALMTRMGAMITIPALVIWIVWQFGPNRRQRFAAGIAAVLVVLCVVFANFLLAERYGPHRGVGGDYFSETAPLTNQLALHVCGLAFGTTWDGCPKRIEEEGKQLPVSEAARAQPFVFNGMAEF